MAASKSLTLVTVLSIAVAIIAVAGLTRLKVASDARVFFDENSEQRQRLQSFENRFGVDTALLIALHNRDGSMLSSANLELVAELTKEAWSLPYASKVESVTNAIHLDSDVDSLRISPMISALSAQGPSRIQDEILSDDLLIGRLITRDKRTTAIVVTFDYSDAQSPVTSRILNETKALVVQHLRGTNIEAWYGGRVATSAAFSDSARFDMLILAPAGYVAMAGFLALALGSGRGSCVLLAVGISAALSSLGIGGWIGLEINAASSAAPMIVVAIAVATFIHLVIASLNVPDADDTQSKDRGRDLIPKAKPIALSLGTTGVGFLSLNFAPAPPIRDLGNLVAIGLGFCALFGFSWIPLALRGSHATPSALRTFFERVVFEVGEGILRNSQKTKWALMAPLITLFAGAVLNDIDDDFNRYLDSRFEYRRDTEAIERTLGGTDVIEFELNSGQRGGVFEPEYMDLLGALEKRLRNRPKVSFVTSLHTTLVRIDKHLRGDGEVFDALPKDPELLAQYLLIYELGLPAGLSLNESLSLDRSSSRISVILGEAKSSDIIRFTRDAEHWVASVSGGRYRLHSTGLSTMYAHVTPLNVKSMLGGTLAALALVSAILIVAFRDLEIGVITLLPNLAPAVAAFGFWGFLVGEIGVAVCVVGVVTLGIVVDDTVHLTWRYLEGARRGLTPDQRVSYVFKIAGLPMLLSTIALVIGFSTVAMSGFLVSNAMGSLAALTVVLALVIDWGLALPLVALSINRRSSENV